MLSSSVPSIPPARASSDEPVLILANPTSGSGRGNRKRLLEAVRRDLEKSGLRSHIGWETSSLAVEERACIATLAGASTVIAAGGDGTVNAVANGILRGGGGASLGVLPLGTGNVFALNMGLDRNWRAACQHIRAGHTRVIDAGRIAPLPGSHAIGPGSDNTATPREKFFLLMAGIGFDAQVIEETSLEMKAVLRDFAYAFTSLGNALTHRGAHVRLTPDDGEPLEREAWLLMAGNAAAYAWSIQFTSRARLDDGMLDLCLFPFSNKLQSAQQVTQLLLGQHIERGAVEYFRTSGVRIESQPPMPIQIDGDEWGTTPARLEILPGALRVLAPPEEPKSSCASP